MAQVVFAAILTVSSAVLFAVAGQLPPSRWEPMGPGGFPRLILGLLTLLSAGALLQALRDLRAQQPSRRDEGADGQPPADASGQHPAVAASQPRADAAKRARVIFTLVAFGVYVALIDLLGFILTTTLFLLAAQWRLGPKGWPQRALMAAIAVILPLGLNVFFQRYIYVFLPVGRVFQ